MVSSTACFEMNDMHSSSLALFQEDQGLRLLWFVAASADSRWHLMRPVRLLEISKEHHCSSDVPFKAL